MMHQLRAPATAAERRQDLWFAGILCATSCLFITLVSQPLFEVLRQPLWVAYLFSIAVAGPVALRRKYPMATAILSSAAYILGGMIGALEPWATQVALFVNVFSVGAYDNHRRRAFWTRLLIVVAMGTWLGVSSYLSYIDPENPTPGAFLMYVGIQTLINIGYFGAAWYFGSRSWLGAIEHQRLDDAQREIAAQHDRLTSQQVELERMRIARELHDVVAHHVSAMGIQAGAARRVLDRDPEQAATSLRSVEQSAREAIAELRNLVTALRSQDEADGPQPTLAELPRLVETATASGQSVALHVIGTRGNVSPLAELTLLRVAQEALTNARKHAGVGAEVDVRLRYGSDATEVEITDNGRGTRGAVPGTGMGLIGMRERVDAVGGTLESGPLASGGWQVRASVPVYTPEPTGSIPVTSAPIEPEPA